MNGMDDYLGMCETIDIHNDHLSNSSYVDLEANENDSHNELMPETNAADECIEIIVETTVEYYINKMCLNFLFY